MKIGIACASGSAKGVFVHGVLAGFQKHGFSADIYSASSSSSIPAAFAAMHNIDSIEGVEYWRQVRANYIEANSDISHAVKTGIQTVLPRLEQGLFTSNASRFVIAVSAVISSEAVKLTQGEGARRLGQQLMLSIRTKDRSWANTNLSGKLFDTGATDPKYRLSKSNLADVLYATTRMLHAWKDSAWIDGYPYIDASYTSSCPARELVQLGMEMVVAITPENGPLYTDFFQSEVMPEYFTGVKIHIVRPHLDLAEIGVDYLKASDEGASKAFALGEEAAVEFLCMFSNK